MGSVTCEMGKGGNNLAGPGAKAAGLQPDLDSVDEWVASADLDAFRKDVKALGDKLLSEQGPDDLAHLQKIISWANYCAAVGLLTVWMYPNPITVIALSTWCCARWTMIGHHVCHGGYDKVDNSGYNRWKFAIGGLSHRLSDWFDWFLPEAWNVEHNNMHHYSLGEANDPDLVENNFRPMRKSKENIVVKYTRIAVMVTTWKWFYYAPNTYKELKLANMRRTGTPIPDSMAKVNPAHAVTVVHLLPGQRPSWFSFSEFFQLVVGPYLLIHFILLPAPLLLIPEAYGGGTTRFGYAVINLVLAEIVTNVHSFIIIVTNHCGRDLYRFEQGVKPKTGTFFMRQVVSSTNFPTGGDFNDFLHGWLNYQIEHHLWPQLSMLSYQRSQPLMKALCDKPGIPYVQENVFQRMVKTVRVMTGQDSMRPFPAHLERKSDLTDGHRSDEKAEGGVAF